MTHPVRLLPALILVLVALALPAQSQSCPDLPGFAPLDDLPVFNGACLLGADDPGFARYDLPTGPMISGAPRSSEPLEGQLQRRLYVAPEGSSPTELFTNYRDALTGMGFQTLFECTGRDCGSNNGLLGKLVIYPVDRRLSNLGDASAYALYIDGDEQFLAARSGDGQRHVAIYVARNQTGAITGASAGRAAVHIDLLTKAALESRMVDAAAIAKGIAEDGHIAVENVHFEFGTADLAPDATPALTEMIRFLTAQPQMRVFVVGHTDGVGAPDTNLDLSQRRAAAVVAALTAQGIAPDRVVPAGAGPYAPRATNATEDGRALNRRVELVER